jgi:mannose-6-phosphate isomerase-like protein (cupin superfamily)
MARIIKLHDTAEMDLGDRHHNVILRTWNRSERTLPGGATHFGFSMEGALNIDADDAQVTLKRGGFFRVQGQAVVRGQLGFALSVPGAKGFTQISGSYDDIRLIDYLPGGEQNCLIWPAYVGFPTLNTLQMRPRQSQDPHAHDSLRINIVIEGSAHCRTPKADLEITAGDVVMIPANESHRFVTRSSGLRFVAFHPDSDESVFSEKRNPMILKTFGLPETSN